ncbi:MAG TPA: dihydrofolate reductase [Kofleriaceae bacterium]|nr:dihydrofolate reductase [Kofleriaceae bacterium]
MTALRANAIDFDIVVAADLGDGIGAGGSVPWNLPTDLAHLKRITSETEIPGMRNAVIMGRVTWETIPQKWRPLPQRLNLIISRQVSLEFPEGAMRAPNLARALEQSRSRADIDRIFVLGGGEIYRQAIELGGCRRLYLTRVMKRYTCDTFFPPIPSHFRREALLAEGADGDGDQSVGYRFELWSRSARS